MAAILRTVARVLGLAEPDDGPDDGLEGALYRLLEERDLLEERFARGEGSYISPSLAQLLHSQGELESTLVNGAAPTLEEAPEPAGDGD